MYVRLDSINPNLGPKESQFGFESLQSVVKQVCKFLSHHGCTSWTRPPSTKDGSEVAQKSTSVDRLINVITDDSIATKMEIRFRRRMKLDS